MTEQGDTPAGSPAGTVYDWYRRGLALLSGGNPAAAVQILARAAHAEPASRSVREALARARFDAGDYPAARSTFAALVDTDPADDYAQFGLGLSARRVGDLDTAVEHLALAVAMRPERREYTAALRRARAARSVVK